jgi:hypothetical protein
MTNDVEDALRKHPSMLIPYNTRRMMLNLFILGGVAACVLGICYFGAPAEYRTAARRVGKSNTAIMAHGAWRIACSAWEALRTRITRTLR